MVSKVNHSIYQPRTITFFTCHIIRDIGGRHDDMMMLGSNSSTPKAKQDRPMGSIFVKMTMTTIIWHNNSDDFIEFIISKHDDNFIGTISCIV